jgi:hypothetical protein
MSTNSNQRAPLWNKSMTRFLGTAAKGQEEAGAGLVKPVAAGLDEKILARLGLKVPPTDPRLLGAFLATDDAADAAVAAEDFARGIRRAVRLNLALAAGLHRLDHQPWKAWVEAHFKVGYACFNRYHVAAELQIGLISRGLPLLGNENQSRSIAAFRRHEKFWDALATFKSGFPPALELKNRLRVTLGLELLPSDATTRIKLHRLLSRVIAAVPATESDPSAGEALALVRRAIGVLEKGGMAA